MGLRPRAAMKRSTTAEDGDMALALALQQSEMLSAARQPESTASTVPSPTSATQSFTCGGSGNFVPHAPQVWHTAGKFFISI